MPLFVIAWTDRPGHLETRLKNREAHLAHVAAHQPMVRLGGPFLDEEGAMTGSMLICEAEDIEAVRAFHEADPYKAAGLIGAVEIRPWRVTVGEAP